MKIALPRTLKVICEPAGLFLYDPETEKRWRGEALSDPLLIRFLLFFQQPRDRGAARTYLSTQANVDDDRAEATISYLLEEGLLVTADSVEESQFGKDSDAWALQGWAEPFSYHLHTVKLPKMDYSADPRGLIDKAMMREYLNQEHPPDNYKIYPTISMISLVSPARIQQRALGETFNDHVGTLRSPGPLSLEEFSWLTYLAFGQTSVRKLPLTGRHIAKTSPSGGARHPTEIYPVVLCVTGIEPGLYHYCCKDNHLELLSPGDHRDFLQRHIITHMGRPTFRVNVAYLFSSIPERSMFRYRESRSYRVLHYDLGHLMQTTAYLASALGRSSYRGYSFHDSVVEDFLGIDGLEETALGFAVIG